jgi:hypothetical protein
VKTIDYATLTDEEIIRSVRQMPPQTLCVEVGKMAPQQLHAIIPLINENHDLAWREKIKAIFLGSQNSEHLKSIGQSIDPKQYLELLTLCVKGAEKETDGSDKLTKLLIGLPHTIFIEGLKLVTPTTLEVLKTECSTEPMLNHLTALIHHFNKASEAIQNAVEKARKGISSLNSNEMTWGSFYSKLNLFGGFAEELQIDLEIIEKALVLAWNAMCRPDLIEKLTRLKEHIQRILILEVGRPSSETNAASGIYANLENHLNAIYGGVEDDALDNDDSALDGLTRLSLWTKEDYFEAGLLPEKEAKMNEEPFISIVESKLASLGLYRVDDLKKRHIYSKQMLKDYIERKKGDSFC